MKFVKMFLIVFALASCSVFGKMSDTESLIDQDIRGDCEAMMREYQRALIARDNAAREYDYARYSRSFTSNISNLQKKYDKAVSDVRYLEREVLPLACSRGSKIY